MSDTDTSGTDQLPDQGTVNKSSPAATADTTGADAGSDTDLNPSQPNTTGNGAQDTTTTAAQSHTDERTDTPPTDSPDADQNAAEDDTAAAETDATATELARLDQDHQRTTGRLTRDIRTAESELAELDRELAALQTELERVEVAHATGVPEDLLIGCTTRADMEQHAALLKQWRADNPLPQRAPGALKSGANLRDPVVYDPRQEATHAVRNTF
ncbi:hypothetical protein KUG88_28125 [Rhodococcus rhodochrous]|uniref:hypothetical protein n=1 Tax=Rhodococcus rhodochrous TaxID=1829 RepID=UPI001E617AB9|nr:hypothetical protein [Rhodococcus rhodochrous]MCB8913972.1 hypothetical protein [Rhodococcus rhodochrous]